MSPVPEIRTFTLGDFQTNCYLITVPGREGCWIVDCGFSPEPMFDAIEVQGLTVKGILITHSHADHIAGLDAARARFGDVPVHAHQAEQGFCSDPMKNLSGMMGMHVTATEPTVWLAGGEELDLDGTTWRVLHTPGHSPGGVCYVHDDSNQAIVGDMLFAGSIGRIDFPTSDPAAMRRSIFDVIMNLPDETTIYPGHMGSTTIGVERHSNMFVVQGF